MSRLKRVTPLTEQELPSPFIEYWKSSERVERPSWRFYDVDGELYIQDTEFDTYLLTHWTQTICCGVSIFMSDNGIKVHMLPLVGIDGRYLFEILYPDEYEISIRTADGKMFVVHKG